jgi:putative transposase
MARQGIRLDLSLGKPQESAYIERYNRTVRYDWLHITYFNRLDEM